MRDTTFPPGSFAEYPTSLRPTLSCLASVLLATDRLGILRLKAWLKQQKAVGRTGGTGGNCTFNSILDFA